MGGEKAPTTWLWVESDAPVPADGSTIEWDGHHVWIDERAYRKVEFDSKP